MVFYIEDSEGNGFIYVNGKLSSLSTWFSLAVFPLFVFSRNSCFMPCVNAVIFLHVYICLERCLIAYFLINVPVKTQLELSEELNSVLVANSLSSQVTPIPLAQDHVWEPLLWMSLELVIMPAAPFPFSAMKLKYKGQHTFPVKNQMVNANSLLKAWLTYIGLPDTSK